MSTVPKNSHELAAQIGATIRHLRKERGMKQEALALEAGYGSRSAIASIENGFILPSLDKTIDIARALGVSVASIVGENPAFGLEEEHPLIEQICRQVRELPLSMLPSFSNHLMSTIQAV